MTPLAAPAFGEAFDRTRRLSQYVARVAAARPGVVAELERRADTAWSREEIRAGLGPGEDLGSRLRSVRERVMVGLAHRDLNGLASLDEVFATMTALAEECIAAAAAEGERRTAAIHGEPANGARLLVAALGKLGGRELNVSSDVDLVFLYGEDGESAGPRAVSHREFFAQAGRTLIALLSEVTAEGQAFRVDMRLRPFGDSGPLVASLASLEDYFISHARPWERYAWMKSRVVAGPEAGVRDLVDPFVYRRYLDYGMLDALRDMHSRIAEAATQRRKTDDIKVGAGGIRELEFAVQLFQMVRGGRDAALRTTSTREALRAIGSRGLVEPARVAALAQAYEFLRRLEHRLQYYDDQQTQALPRAAEHQATIAAAMDYPGYGALLAALDGHRGAVQAAFNALFEQGPQPKAPAAARLAASLSDPQATPDPEAIAEELGEAGIVEPAAVARRLIEYTRSRRYRSISASSRAKVEALLPKVIAAAAVEGGHEATAMRLFDLIEAIDGREAYFSLLVEYPQVLARAARLVARSAWAARLLARHPILLDELTRTAASFAATDWEAERASLAAECTALSGDVERLLDHLRHFKQRHVLRFTIADIEGELPVMALSDELSMLADVVLDVTLVEAAKSHGFSPSPLGEGRGEGRVAGDALGPRRHEGDDAPPAIAGDALGPRRHEGDDAPPAIAGHELGPRRHEGDDAPPAIAGFCVVGYGKLGGKELGYGSDLDVIFLYDETMAAHAEKLARVAQRVNTWMTTHTGGGVLYETDLRLRPDGLSGLMVSSIGSFRDYQMKRAWTWEHQALTRARACAGDRALGARFEALRDAILAQPRDLEKLLSEIVAMRRKMRAEHKADANDIKHVEGGIIDLEFAVQALVLAHGPRHAQLRENKGNHTLLRRAGALGLIAEASAAAAGDAYLAMRQRSHQGALNDEEKVRLAPEELAGERAAVRQLWKEVFG